MKYNNRPDVAFPLGQALAKHWQQQSPSIQRRNTYAIPIPLHPDRQKSRGYNQAERIAAAFCQMSRLPLLAHGLQRIKVTQPQHLLGLNERQQNLEHVFQPGKVLKRIANRQSSRSHPGNANLTVVLIDDIYTTGATIQSAITALEKIGVSVTGIAVLAQAKLT